MKKTPIILTTIIALFSLSTTSAQEVAFETRESQFANLTIKKIDAPNLTSFEEATKWADLVAIAQVESVEYDQVRNLNSKGYAYLNVLVPYKGSQKDEPIAVVATGFEDNVCYFPDEFNTGERYLVFLKQAPDQEKNVYYGFKPFCQMQILLSELGQYILRTPLDTELVKIDDSLIKEQEFNDSHAMLDTTLWTSVSRNEYAEKFKCNIIESEDDFKKFYHLRYTQGVPIYDIRPLLKLEYKPRISSKQL